MTFIGLFYAAQTLQQLAQTDGQGNTTLPLGVIKDYPDVAYRGTVEGFYGDPWSHTDRIEQLRFYGKMKMNTYIYGPKDDPYHSSISQRSQLAFALSGKGSSTDQGSREGSRRQQGRLRLGDPSGPGHQMDR